MTPTLRWAVPWQLPRLLQARHCAFIVSYNAHVDQGLYAQAKYRRIADLKGQPIGSLNPGGLVDTMVRRILVKNGLQPERDVNLLAMGGTPERFAALRAGAIAATMLSSPFNFLADKEGFSKLATTREYVDVPGTAVVVHADKIKTRPDTSSDSCAHR